MTAAISTLATVVSSRQIGLLNLYVEVPFLALVSFAGPWWPVYWGTTEEPQINRREIVAPIVRNGLVGLLGVLFPAFESR